MPTVWWLRPVRSACRVGEQSAVVWKRLYLRPVAARRSAFGVLIGPPKALEAPKPTSSIRTIRTLGAPSRTQRLDRRKDGVWVLRVVSGQPHRSDIGNGQNIALLRALGHACLLVAACPVILTIGRRLLIARRG